MADEVLGKIGRCIYCGTTMQPLSREHIIPFGLSGKWVLEEASCQRCADITSAVEMYVLRTQLLRPRAGLALQTRRKRERPNRFPLEFVRHNQIEIQELSMSEQPIFMLLPLYDWPEIVAADWRHDSVSIGGIGLVGTDYIQVAGRPLGEFSEWLVTQGISKVTFRQKFKADVFARMIAKIAYGFAVVHVGLENIEHAYVLPAILGEANDTGRWVGCDLEAHPIVEDLVHRVDLQIVDGDILVRVKLFAQFGTQEYLVAVGRRRSTP